MTADHESLHKVAAAKYQRYKPTSEAIRARLQGACHTTGILAAGNSMTTHGTLVVLHAECLVLASCWYLMQHDNGFQQAGNHLLHIMTRLPEQSHVRNN
jgi:hypothetical protein